MMKFNFKSAEVISDAPAEYVLSDGGEDRSGDVIEPGGWVLPDTGSIIALFNHRRDAIIGRWENLRVKAGQLIGKLVLAEKGTSPLVNMVRSLIGQEMIDGVSVGFKPIDMQPLDKKDPWGPQRHSKQELLEGSLVAVPANPRAKRILKSFMDDPATAQFFQPGNATAHPNPTNKCPPTQTPKAKPMSAMPLAEAIPHTKGQIVKINDELSEIKARVEAAGCDISDNDQTLIATLGAEFESATAKLKSLEDFQKLLAARAVAQPQPELPEHPELAAPGAGTANNRRLSGAFVGEGQPIPVRQGLLKSLLLNAYKAAVISTFTKEMANSSTPQIEAIIRDAIIEDTAWAIDLCLLDAVAQIAGIRPAGLYNGVAALPAAAAGPDAALKDIKALVNAITANNGGRNFVWIMNPAQSASLELTTESGIFVFNQLFAQSNTFKNRIVSNTQPAGTVTLIDAADFASSGGNPAFDISDQATLHMDDGTYNIDGTVSTVKQIVGAAAPPPAPADIATPVTSLFQTASVAVRMMMPISWGMRRAGMIAWIQGVNW